MNRHHAILTLSIFLIAFVVAGGLFFIRSEHTLGYAISLPFLPQKHAEYLSHGSEARLSNSDFFNEVKADFLEKKSDLVEADLSAMVLRVYQKGEQVLEVPILTKGREGSWWETPAGLYAISTKAKSHFSSFGKVYQPWSMAFQGNFFIHGWPYYPDGEPVPQGYSGGCIRLSTEDAKRVFDLVEVGTPVLVFEEDFSSDGFSYTTLDTPVTAAAYLAADVGNNQLLYGKDTDTLLPIASITKLMTALVATEYLNLDTEAVVPPEAIVYTSRPRFSVGESVSIYQLLFPLLTESSNEAAEIIARHYGRDRFVARMNEKAASIGMSHTVFTDPSGADAGNVSTAEDLFVLAKSLYNNRKFILDISSGKLKGSAYGAPTFADLRNFNDLYTHPYFIGGKVGQTGAAGETNLSIFEVPVGATTRPIAFVVLNAKSSKDDLTVLLETILARFSLPQTLSTLES